MSPDRYEAIYANMPEVGLAAATRHMPVTRRGDAAADRLRDTSARIHV